MMQHKISITTKAGARHVVTTDHDLIDSMDEATDVVDNNKFCDKRCVRTVTIEKEGE